MTPTTLGKYLVSRALPPGETLPENVTKGGLNKALFELAKKDTAKYPDVVRRLKKLGDELATLDGISVGLEDVDPDVKARDAVLRPHAQAFDAATTDDERKKAIMAAQTAMLDYAKQHKGSLGEMVRSGGRGNYAQLMKIVASPVAAKTFRGDVVPFLIRRSYTEGLSPAEMWVTGDEARVNAIASNISVVEPGDLNKILINNLNDKVVASPDCGTRNGISLAPGDPNLLGRYVAGSQGTFIDPAVFRTLRDAGKAVVARSPMTCEAPAGVCQRCMGHGPDGQAYTIGTNVGIRSSQAMAEPLTQMALSAKHGGQLTKALPEARLEGIRGVRQLLEVPKSFAFKATLADEAGTVTRVEEAPQGGHYVYVNSVQHYVTPPMTPRVRPGDIVAAGDVLSSGIPKPDELIAHKGLGVGRDYLVRQLNGLYSDHGVDLDRRHFELLARTLLNWVRVEDPGNAEETKLLRGDVVNYNTFRSALRNAQRSVPVADAVGEVLADNVLHYTAGTRVDDRVLRDLQAHTIAEVKVGSPGAPRASPIVRPATRAPLLNPDWMARLGHRYLKEGLLQGAHIGAVSDLSGTNPVPAYVQGTTFGQGVDGRY